MTGARAALLAWALACRTAVTAEVPVAEPFDVPPPPGQRALELGPVASVPDHVKPGAVVWVQGEAIELLDRRAADGGATLTVYADEALAERWLAAGRVAVRWAR